MIELAGVAVPTRDTNYVGEIRPYDHQIEAERLIESTESFWAVNSSPTGSGKTYSWLKPVVDQQINAIAVYPTNALTADQEAAANDFIKEYFNERDIDVLRATSETIADWQQKARTSIDKGGALRRAVSRSLERYESTILITNPDTFVLVRKNLYGNRFVDKEFNQFEMIVLDEFHIANVKQRDSLLFLLDELVNLPDEIALANKVYFLTATPEQDEHEQRGLLTRIEEAVDIHPRHIKASGYPTGVNHNHSPSEDARTVMPMVDLELRGAATFRCADELLDEETLEEFVEFCGAGQTVVMVDGVDEVDRIYERLLDELSGKRVERVSGFHGSDVETKLEKFDVLVSNSAVEVGLDFQPERVIFSATNASSLIQRLGRLRKRSDLDRAYKAWCYVPPSVKAKLKERLNSEFETGERVSRDGFERVVNDMFTKKCDVSSFTKRWSDRLAFHHVQNRASNTPSDLKREEILNTGLERIKRHFYDPYSRPFGKAGLKALDQNTDWKLLDRIQSYRGDSMQVMLYNPHSKELKLADLFFVLRWGNVIFMPQTEFESLLPADMIQQFNSKKRYALGFCEYRGKIDRVEGESGYPGRSVSLHDQLGGLHDIVDSGPTVQDGIGVSVDPDGAPPVDGLDHLQDHMIDKKRVCYVLPGNPNTNKAVYDFDQFFFVYALDEVSVTIGTTALFTHCLVEDRRERKTNENWDW